MISFISFFLSVSELLIDIHHRIVLTNADSGFVPIFMYAIFGSSRQLAIGPVALVSLLVSNVLGSIVDSSDDLYTELAILLALMVGILECTMGLLRYEYEPICFLILVYDIG